MRMKFKLNSSAFVASLVFPVFLASSVQAQSLNEALSGLLSENGTIESAAQSLRSAESNVESVRTRLYPKLTVESSLKRKKLDNGTTRGLGFNNGETKTVRSTSLKLKQGIFSGFSDVARIEEAEAGLGRAQAKLLAVQQAELGRGAAAYYAVLQEKSLIDSLTRTKALSSEMLELARETKKNGGNSDATWLKAQKDTLDKEAKLVAQKHRLARAVGDYVRYFGAEPDMNAMAFVTIDDGRMPVSQEDLLSQIENSADILEGFRKAEMSQARVKREKSSRYPTLSLNLAHERDNDSFIRGAAGGRSVDLSRTDETSLELSLKWELSALLYSRHAINKAASTSLSDRAKARALLKRLEGQAVKLWDDYGHYRHEIRLLDEIRQKESRLEEIEADKIAAGGGKRQDLLKLKMANERTVQRLIRANHSLEQTKVRILALVNQMTADV